MDQIVSNPDSQMMREVGKLNAEKRGVHDEESENEETLPAGSEPLEASSSAETESSEEASESAGGEAPAEQEDEPIRINGQEFKNQKEAFEYAEKLAREKDLTDAHAQGIREALEASRVQTQAPPPEENFEEKFYADPKKTLGELKAQARDEAIALIREEQQREKAWNEFLADNPDIRRKDAERVLQDNWETLGKMTDLDRAKKLLAQKVRAEYAEIAELMKPRTELQGKKQTLSPAGGSRPGVTPAKKEEKVLSFADQMRKLKG